MLVRRVVRVRFVMGINGSRSVHFRKKVTGTNIEREALIAKPEISKSGEKTSMVYVLLCAKFPGAK